MNPAAAADPQALLGMLPFWAFAFVLLLARLGCACMLLPGIGEADLPVTIRAGAAIGLTALLLPVIGPRVPAMPPGVPALATMVMAEIATGLWLGWLTRLVLFALPMAGQVIAGVIGMANVIQPDALLGAGTAALGRLMGIAAPVLVMSTGLYALPLQALAGSYDVIAPGALLPSGDGAEVYVTAVAESFGLALRLAAPFLLAGVLFHVSLGLVARLVPQLQTYFAAVPGQILGGLLLLAALAASLADTWTEAARSAFAMLPGH